MTKRTDKQIKALADAVWQVLDDMGAKGHSACGYTKALLRKAFEPWAEEQADGEPDGWPDMTLADAEAIIKSVENG